MKGDDIADRLLDFAVRVIRLTDSLPKSDAGRHVAKQLLRSGTSPGANYEEGRGAESRADFIHKLGIAWKEAKESLYWLRVIQRAEMVQQSRLDELLQEANELCAILATSVSTAKRKKGPENPKPENRERRTRNR